MNSKPNDSPSDAMMSLGSSSLAKEASKQPEHTKHKTGKKDTTSTSSIINEKKTKRKRKAADSCTERMGNRWEIMFERLEEFKRQHGHCLVPNRYKEDRSLGSWVSTQRRQFKILTSGSSESTPMTPERASRLVSIGFQWTAKDPRHIPWETRFHELCKFKDKHGHCLVPAGSKLAYWVATQRQGRSAKKLTPERVKALDEIGFIWEAPRRGRRKNEEFSASPTNPQDCYSSMPAPAVEGGAIQSSLPFAMNCFQPTSTGVESLLAINSSDLHAQLPAMAGMPSNRTIFGEMIGDKRDTAALYVATGAARVRERTMMFDAMARKQALRHQRDLLLSSHGHSLDPSPYLSGLIQRPSESSLLNQQGAFFCGAQHLASLAQTNLSQESWNRSSRKAHGLQESLLGHDRIRALSSSLLLRQTEEALGDFIEKQGNGQYKRLRHG